MKGFEDTPCVQVRQPFIPTIRQHHAHPTHPRVWHRSQQRIPPGGSRSPLLEPPPTLVKPRLARRSVVDSFGDPSTCERAEGVHHTTLATVLSHTEWSCAATRAR